MYELINGLLCAYIRGTSLASVAIALPCWYLAKSISVLTVVGGNIKVLEAEGSSVGVLCERYTKSIKSAVITGILAVIVIFPIHFIALKLLNPTATIVTESWVYIAGVSFYCLLGPLRNTMVSRFVVIGDLTRPKVQSLLINQLDIIFSIILLFVFKAGILSVGLSDSLACLVSVIYLGVCKSKVKLVKSHFSWTDLLERIKLSQHDFLICLMYAGIAFIVNMALIKQGIAYLTLFAIADRVQMVFECTGKLFAKVYRNLYAIYSQKARSLRLEFMRIYLRAEHLATFITIILLFIVPVVPIKAFNFTALGFGEAYFLLFIYMLQFTVEYKYYRQREHFNFFQTGKVYTVILVLSCGVAPVLCS